MTRILSAALVLACLPVHGHAGKSEPLPVLAKKGAEPSGAFTFEVPDDWTIEPAGEPGALVAAGGDSLIFFLYTAGEVGYDGLHATCMMQRLAGQMEADPNVQYEYDYEGSQYGTRRALDSAFVVKYDSPHKGHTKWRQRNLTIVGGGHSLCLIAHTPAPVWKKSAPARALVQAILGSVKFPE